MDQKKAFCLIFIILITACIPQLVANSNAKRQPSVTPFSSANDNRRFIPLILNRSPSTPTTQPTPSPTAQPTPSNGQSIIANHFVVDQFDQIPDSAIQAAATKTILFKHASVGNYINSFGLDCLQGTIGGDPCNTYPDYKYDRQNWDWELWNPFVNNYIEKVDQFASVVADRHGNYEILGMKFCYLNDGEGEWPYYRDEMLKLEAAHPDKIFIWATKPLVSENHPMGPDMLKNLQGFNSLLRAFAQDNNKPLFDIADIESHDANGNPCQSDGWESMCPEYGRDLGHPNLTGSLRLAKGFWWLMARISGWDGSTP